MGFATMDITERDILRLHETMLSYTHMVAGRYKQADNIMEVGDKRGRTLCLADKRGRDKRGDCQ